MRDRSRKILPSTNAEIAELLSREAEDAPYLTRRACRRAARSAFLWPEEARDLIAADRELTEPVHVGPFVEKMIERWIRQTIHPPSPPPIRKGFLTLVESELNRGACGSF